MKRFFLLLMVGVLLLAGCAKPYDGIHVKSIALKSMVPSGLKTMNATIQMTVINEGNALEVKNTVIDIKLSGKKITTLKFDDIIFKKKSEETMDCIIHAELAEGQNIMTILKLAAGNFDPKEATADISFSFGIPGARGTKFEMKNRPVGNLLKQAL